MTISPSIHFVVSFRWAKRLRYLAWVVLFGVPYIAAGQPTHTNRWTLKFDWYHCDSTPAVAVDGMIYVGTFSGKLWAIDTNGFVRWTFTTSSEVRSSPAIGADGTIYFGSRDRNLYAVNPRGREKWSVLTGGWVDSSPAIANDATVYAGSWDRFLYAIDTNGAVKWKFQTEGPIDSSPAIGHDGTVYFGSHDKRFYALSPDGRKRWDFATGGAIISSPALNGDGVIYFTSVDGFLYSLTEEGELRWRLRTGGIAASSPALGPDGVIYLGVNEYLWAVAPNGEKKWQHFIFSPLNSTPTVVEGETIYVAAPFHELYAFDFDHRLRWSFGAWSYDEAMSPAVGVDGTVYCMRDSNIFLAVDTTAGLAKSPWPKFRGNARNTGNVSDRH